MNTKQIDELINRLRAAKAKYFFNPDEGLDGTLWIGNLEAIEVLDLVLLRTYESQIKEYFKYNMRDLL